MSIHDIMSTTIRVNWEELEVGDRNGLITMYDVMYLPLENFGGAIGANTVNVPGRELSVVLMGLQEYINYKIFVRAYTSAGYGPFSLPLTVSTLEDGNYIYQPLPIEFFICMYIMPEIPPHTFTTPPKSITVVWKKSPCNSIPICIMIYING